MGRGFSLIRFFKKLSEYQMDAIEIDPQWFKTYPGAHIGLLLIGNVDNAKQTAALDEHKRQVEAAQRKRFADFSRQDLLALDVLKAYRSYYKKFNKTYHVLLQLESIVHKGKKLPNVNPLVDANFAAEIETLLLTAGHDADTLQWPVAIGVSQGTESFVPMNGSQRTLKAGDMIMKDRTGVVCTVIYGQDNTSPISRQTRRVLYVTYVPAGVKRATVENHLETITTNVLRFEPQAKVEYREIHSAA
jgi:DNA/RNA-binding domain of Phe-tRNA-synthetase-like protein